MIFIILKITQMEKIFLYFYQCLFIFWEEFVLLFLKRKKIMFIEKILISIIEMRQINQLNLMTQMIIIAMKIVIIII